MPDGTGPSIVPAEAGPDIPSDPTRRRGWKRFLPGATPQSSAPVEQALNGRAQIEIETSEAERDMMSRIAAFKKKRVDDVAIPRADIVGVEATTEIDDLLKIFSEANHSRLPVYRGDLDDPVGVVHIKDVVGHLADGHEDGEVTNRPPLDALVRKLLYVPPSMPVTELLLRMQASRTHMALVIDEFGGTDGLVTIEDLVELIVGDIRDEHDEDEDFDVGKVGDSRWEADARVPLEELESQVGVAFSLEDHEADTLGGLVFSLAGRVPQRGEVILHPNGSDIDVLSADPRRIHRVRIRLKSRTPDPDTLAGQDIAK